MKYEDYDVPDDLKYTEKHQWAKVEGDNIRIGITDFAKKQLKEIVFVEFIAQVGDAIDAASDEPIATLESTKAVGEIFAPVSGEVIEVNEALEDDPDPNLSDPYGNGWMYVVKASNKDGDLGNLLNAAAYVEAMKKEA